MDLITPQELYQRLAGAEQLEGAEKAPLVLDVRQAQETLAEGQIAGALCIPLDQLGARVREIAQGREVVTVCKRGARSLNAAQWLAQSGHRVKSMSGGMDAWLAAGLPVQR